MTIINNLVSTWLRGIGLTNTQILHNFESAGCTSAQHLTSLQLSDYDALLSYLDDETGMLVEPSEDQKKKLYYLVQRVRMAVQNGAHGNSSSNYVSEENGGNLDDSRSKDDDIMTKNVKSRVSATNDRRRSLRLARKVSSDQLSGSSSLDSDGSLNDKTRASKVQRKKQSSEIAIVTESGSQYTSRSKLKANKRLSAIPSDSAAAMSPLPVKPSFSYTCDKINEDDKHEDNDTSYSTKSSISTRSSGRREAISSNKTDSIFSTTSKNTSTAGRRASYSSSKRSSVGKSSNSFESDSRDNNSISRRSLSSSSRRKSVSSSTKSGIVAPSSRARGRSSIGTYNSSDTQTKSRRKSTSLSSDRKTRSASPPPQQRPVNRRTSSRGSSSVIRRSLSAPTPARLVESKQQNLNSSGEYSTSASTHIHGEQRDKSWETMVSVLREENSDSGKENVDSTYFEDDDDMRIRVAIR